MKTFDFDKKYSKPIVLSLGFFDCIHIGHKSLISTANEIAKSLMVESFVLTFSNDPSDLFGKSRQIYTYLDRLEALETLGVQGVISATFDEDFANLSPEEFLTELFSNYDAKCVVVGADYTFGINAKGNVEFLKSFCSERGIKVEVVPFECVNGEKLSTRNLKSFLDAGDVKGLNANLSEPYFMLGQVARAKHNGTRMGFPTANICQNPERYALADGVYATKTIIDGREYVSMTNVGAKPTFNDFSDSVETHIMGFYGDLYGKPVKIAFFDRIRDIKQFGSVDELKAQLEKDEEYTNNLFKN